MRKNGIKNTRINGEVQKELSRIIQNEIKDPRIAPMTSVVAVEVAPDLKTCKAYISVLGDAKAAEDTLAGLKSAEGYVRRQKGQGRSAAEHLKCFNRHQRAVNRKSGIDKNGLFQRGCFRN